MDFLCDILVQIEIIFKGIPQHFKEFSVSAIFFVFVMWVFALNICKKIFVWWEKKKGTPHTSCEYLITVKGGQDCNHSLYRKQFKQNGNSCEKCKGKSFVMTDAEAENRVLLGRMWKRIIVFFANQSKNILPYISFLYTLAITIFENSK